MGDQEAGEFVLCIFVPEGMPCPNVEQTLALFPAAWGAAPWESPDWLAKDPSDFDGDESPFPGQRLSELSIYFDSGGDEANVTMQQAYQQAMAAMTKDKDTWAGVAVLALPLEFGLVE